MTQELPQYPEESFLHRAWQSKWFRIGVLTAALASIAVGARYIQIRQRFTRMREAGLQAAEKGDAAAANELLARYLQRFPNDRTALVAFCGSRPMVTDEQGRYIAETIRACKHLLEIDPSRKDQRRQLMHLYFQQGDWFAAAVEADNLIKADSEDLDAHKTRTLALIQRHRLSESNDAMVKLERVGGFHLDVELSMLRLMKEMRLPPEQITERCDATLRDHEPEAARLIAASYGYSIAHSSNTAKLTELLDGAIRTYLSSDHVDRADATMPMTLARILDDHGRYDDSLKVLRRPGASAPPEVQLMLSARLMVAGQWDQAITAASSLADSPPALAIATICASAAGHESEGAPAREKLPRLSSPAGRGWSAVARRLSGHAEQAPADEAINAIRTMHVAADERELRAIQLLAAGDCMREMGESDLALESFRESAILSPAWVVPTMRSLAILIEAGRWRSALELAQEASRRAPNSAAVAEGLLQAWAVSLDRVDLSQISDAPSDIAQSLTKLLEELQKLNPTSQSVLCTRVQLLAGGTSTRAQSAELIRQAIAQRTDLTAGTLLRLASISQSLNHEITQTCLDAAYRSAPDDPQVALARAADMLEQGHKEQAYQVMAPAGVRSPTTSATRAAFEALLWQAARAQFLELANDPSSHDAIAKLSDDHPNDVSAQLAALKSRSAATDPDLGRRIAARVQTIAGDQGLEWRLGRVRAILARQPLAPESRDEAGKLLAEVLKHAPYSAHAHALFAAFYEITLNPSQALKEWATAYSLSPGDPNIAVGRARALLLQGETGKALESLKAITKRPPTDSRSREQIAIALADCGQFDDSIAFLTAVPSDNETTLLVLAEIYLRAGKLRDARQTVERIPPPHHIAVAELKARILQAEGKTPEARAALMQLSKGAERGAVLTAARRSLEIDGAEASIPLFQQASQLFPKDANAAGQFIACLIQAGKGDAALAAIGQASTAMPDDARIHQIAAEKDLLQFVAGRPELQPYAFSLVDNPFADAPLIRAVRILMDRTTPPKVIAEKIDALASEFGSNFDLARLAIERDVPSRRLDSAQRIADHAAEIFPASDQPQTWRYTILAARGDWEGALSAVSRWREHTIANSTQQERCDLAKAQCLLRLRRGREAIATLETYADRALADPAAYSLWVSAYVAACVDRSSQLGLDAARKRLNPLLATSAGRERWIAACGAISEPDQSVAWLETASPLIPPKEVNTRVLLASTWQLLALRRTDTRCLQGQQEALAPLLEEKDLPPEALMAIAQLYDQQGKVEEAIKAYRRLCATTDHAGPNNLLPAALNNLSTLLAHHATSTNDLPEAVTLATRAVSLANDVAAFHDTLADAYSRQKQYRLAQAELQKAVAIAPAASRYRLRLAQALSDEGQTDVARRAALELAQNLAAADSAVEPLSDDDRQRLNALLMPTDR